MLPTISVVAHSTCRTYATVGTECVSSHYTSRSISSEQYQWITSHGNGEDGVRDVWSAKSKTVAYLRSVAASRTAVLASVRIEEEIKGMKSVRHSRTSDVDREEALFPGDRHVDLWAGEVIYSRSLGQYPVWQRRWSSARWRRKRRRESQPMVLNVDQRRHPSDVCDRMIDVSLHENLDNRWLDPGDTSERPVERWTEPIFGQLKKARHWLKPVLLRRCWPFHSTMHISHRYWSVNNLALQCRRILKIETSIGFHSTNALKVFSLPISARR